MRLIGSDRSLTARRVASTDGLWPSSTCVASGLRCRRTPIRTRGPAGRKGGGLVRSSTEKAHDPGPVPVPMGPSPRCTKRHLPRPTTEARSLTSDGIGVLPVGPEPPDRWVDRSRGQAIVEFALIFPIFLLLLLIAVDAGRLYFSLIQVHNAAREGAAVGAVSPTDLAAITARARQETNAQAQRGEHAIAVAVACASPSGTSIACSSAPGGGRSRQHDHGERVGTVQLPDPVRQRVLRRRLLDGRSGDGRRSRVRGTGRRIGARTVWNTAR